MSGRVGEALRRTAGVWGPASFAAAVVAAPRLQPGYSHRSHHISGLAARGERSGMVMVPGFVALGASQLLAPMPDAVLARLARVAGGTTLAAGLIPASHPSCPRPGIDPEATSSDVGHAIASITTFATWVVMPVVAARRSAPISHRRLSAALAPLVAGGCAGAAVTTAAGSANKGVAQRLFVGSVLAWQVATALRRQPTGSNSGT